MVWLSAFAVPTTAHAEKSEDTTHIDVTRILENQNAYTKTMLGCSDRSTP